MIAQRHGMAICLGLATWCWCSVGASYAEDRSVLPQSKNTTHPVLAVSPSDIPWHDLTWVERRYKIEAMRFKARDETGIDWWGDDEVMIETVDAKGWTVSHEFGSVDSGETHKLDPAKSCIIAVRPGIVVLGKSSVCDDVGEPAPLGFSVEFWEKDLLGFPIGFCKRIADPGPDRHRGWRDCANDGHGDDFIGRARIDLSQQDLDVALPNVNDEYVETVVLFPCTVDVSVCDVTWGPDYTFTYRITRLPDARGGLHGLLDEAMHKIGTRSEIETIAAGLRALRAPSSRTVVSEADAMPLKR